MQLFKKLSHIFDNNQHICVGMALDYYEILQIEPSAGMADIKAAYRRLAHQYHPDKNPDNQSAQAYFSLIKEAYDTLSNPARKVKYLEERWLLKANGRSFEQPLQTPEHILRRVLAASDRINQMDIYRMDKEGIKNQLDGLLNSENIIILNSFNEVSVNDAIVRELLSTMTVLPTQAQIYLLQVLRRVQSSYAETIKLKQEELDGRIFWETWKPAFVILLVVLLCILIWGTSLK